MSDAAQSCREGPGAHRQAFADRMLAHRLNGVCEAASAAGYTRFEIARAMLRFAVEEMMVVGCDPELLDAAFEEATFLAAVVESRTAE